MIAAETRFLKKVSRFAQIKAKNGLFLKRYLNPSDHFGIFVEGSIRSRNISALMTMKIGAMTPIMTAVPV